MIPITSYNYSIHGVINQLRTGGAGTLHLPRGSKFTVANTLYTTASRSRQQLLLGEVPMKEVTHLAGCLVTSLFLIVPIIPSKIL